MGDSLFADILRFIVRFVLMIAGLIIEALIKFYGGVLIIALVGYILFGVIL